MKDCGIGRVEVTLFPDKLWNVGSVVILSLINMARCPMNTNAISDPSASKPSLRALTHFITGDESVQSKCNRFCKLIVKEVVCAASAAYRSGIQHGCQYCSSH